MRTDPGPAPTQAQRADIETARTQVHFAQQRQQHNPREFARAVADYARACRAAGVLEPPRTDLWPLPCGTPRPPQRSAADHTPNER